MKTYGCPNTSELLCHSSTILETMEEETVDVYLFIADEFQKGNMLSNRVFQFVYWSFYGLDNAGLTDKFRCEYFRLLESARYDVQANVRDIVERLYEFPNRQGKQSVQFSFATKLLHTVNSTQYPIYDSKVALIFGFKAPYNYSPFEKRLEEYVGFYNHLQKTYADTLANGVLDDLISRFRQRFPQQQFKISNFKVLDFVFWSAGKLKGKNWNVSDQPVDKQKVA